MEAAQIDGANAWQSFRSITLPLLSPSLYYVTLISDGCATVTPELQHATITTMKDRYARVLTATEAISEIESFEEITRVRSVTVGMTG